MVQQAPSIGFQPAYIQVNKKAAPPLLIATLLFQTPLAALEIPQPSVCPSPCALLRCFMLLCASTIHSLTRLLHEADSEPSTTMQLSQVTLPPVKLSPNEALTLPPVTLVKLPPREEDLNDYAHYGYVFQMCYFGLGISEEESEINHDRRNTYGSALNYIAEFFRKRLVDGPLPSREELSRIADKYQLAYHLGYGHKQCLEIALNKKWTKSDLRFFNAYVGNTVPSDGFSSEEEEEEKDAGEPRALRKDYKAADTRYPRNTEIIVCSSPVCALTIEEEDGRLCSPTSPPYPQSEAESGPESSGYQNAELLCSAIRKDSNTDTSHENPELKVLKSTKVHRKIPRRRECKNRSRPGPYRKCKKTK